MRTKRPRRHLLPALALIVIAGLAAGCSSGDAHSDAGPQATVATAPSTTTTTAPADPYAVPDDASKIDADYVNRVLAALNHIYGDIARAQLTNGAVKPESLLSLRAIYNDPEYQEQAEVLLKSVPPPRDRLRDPLGDRQMTVLDLLTVRSDCIAAKVLYDFSEVLLDPGSKDPWWIALSPKPRENDPGNVNPTPWALRSDGPQEVDACT